ncbi:MAG: ankyrin repeat domain-containing protein [Alphaproteobacteria bacterium]|nr:ankyrin repeat domain-containing protein [Alphaproteobacteria bacterium]
MNTTSNLNPHTMSQKLWEAFKTGDSEFINKYMAYVATLPEEKRIEFLNTPAKNGYMPIHMAIYRENTAVAEQMFQYYKGHDLPDTDIMGPDEYESIAERPQYNFIGTPDPNGVFDSDDKKTRRYIGYSSGESFDKEVCIDGKNHLLVAVDTLPYEGDYKKSKIVQSVLAHSTQQDFQQAINQALYRNDIDAVEKLIKIGKDKNWAPSAENVENVDEFTYPVIDGENANHIPQAERSMKAYTRGVKATLQAMRTAKKNKLYKEFTQAVKSGNKKSAQALAKECFDLMYDEALSDFAKANNPEAMKYLIEAGADINALNKEGKTPLMVALKHHAKDVIPFLIKHPNIDLNVQDESGNTALHIATKDKLYPTVKLLSEQGARVDIKNEQGKTPVDIAKEVATPTDRSILNVLTRRKPQGLNETLRQNSSDASKPGRSQNRTNNARE